MYNILNIYMHILYTFHSKTNKKKEESNKYCSHWNRRQSKTIFNERRRVAHIQKKKKSI